MVAFEGKLKKIDVWSYETIKNKLEWRCNVQFEQICMFVILSYSTWYMILYSFCDQWII